MTKCKYCGSSDVYEGLNEVECATDGCKGFSAKHLEMVNSRIVNVINDESVASINDDLQLWPTIFSYLP